MKLNPLFESDINALHQARREGDGERYTVRFLVNGEALQLGSCRTAGKGCNVIYQPHYWSVPQAFIDLAIERVQLRNPGIQVRAIKHPEAVPEIEDDLR